MVCPPSPTAVTHRQNDRNVPGWLTSNPNLVFLKVSFYLNHLMEETHSENIE